MAMPVEKIIMTVFHAAEEPPAPEFYRDTTWLSRSSEAPADEAGCTNNGPRWNDEKTGTYVH